MVISEIGSNFVNKVFSLYTNHLTLVQRAKIVN